MNDLGFKIHYINVKLHCPNCKVEVNHKMIISNDITGQLEQTTLQLNPMDFTFEIVNCKKCGGDIPLPKMK